MRSAKRGFTLIELLVVIAIIALLAAILFPVFAAAREKARQTACLSNEKQLGTAFVQYVQDYDEAPMLCNNVHGDWVGPIYPYVKSLDVFRCPDDSSTETVATIHPISYAMNFNVVSAYGIFSPKPPSITLFGAPSSSVLMFEIQVKNNSGGITTTTNPPSELTVDARGVASTFNSADPQPYDAYYQTGFIGGMGVPANVGLGCNPLAARCWLTAGGVHTGGSNFIFCDGHVKWLAGTQVSGGWNALAKGCPQGNATPAACHEGFCDLTGCYPAGTAGHALSNAAGTDMLAQGGWSATFSIY